VRPTLDLLRPPTHALETRPPEEDSYSNSQTQNVDGFSGILAPYHSIGVRSSNTTLCQGSYHQIAIRLWVSFGGSALSPQYNHAIWRTIRPRNKTRVHSSAGWLCSLLSRTIATSIALRGFTSPPHGETSVYPFKSQSLMGSISSHTPSPSTVPCTYDIIDLRYLEVPISPHMQTRY
jgi:hypothetical protein